MHTDRKEENADKEFLFLLCDLRVSAVIVPFYPCLSVFIRG